MSTNNYTLTAERLRELLDYDPETGAFKWRVAGKGIAHIGCQAGAKRRDGRSVIRIDNTLYMAYRVAWLHMTGEWPGGDIDHINGDPTDDRFENLRDVSRSVNLQNQRRARSNSRSGVLGVFFQKTMNKWTAKLQLNWKTTSLGYFDTKEEAHLAYLKAKRELHEGCTI
jgi:hypothetical protein